MSSTIHSAAIHLLRRVAQVDSELGISPARASALSVLVFGGPRSLTELAQAERVTAATMSRLVTAMEEEGLVRREPHEADGRSVRLHPTPKARRLLERGRARRERELDTLFAELPERDRQTIDRAAAIIESCLAASSASSPVSSTSRARTR
jgi:DNA-binding MarR family transcriptional regulator